MLDSVTFQTVIESTPLVSIYLSIVRDHQILLGLRNNEPLAGRWFTPGGRLLKNEPWQQGLERIAQAEHWVVVSGITKVRNGEREFLLSENQSTYVPLGAVHALENPGETPLEIIKVQSGSCLGEDNIIRYEGLYGRAEK